METLNLAKKIAQLADEKKADDIVILDVRKLSIPTDYMVICSGSIAQHLGAIKNNILDKLSEDKIKPWHIEGTKESNWILLDFIDIVVHLFLSDARYYYDLERLWGEAERINFTPMKMENTNETN